MNNKDLEIFNGLEDSYDFVKAIEKTDGYHILMMEFEEGGRWSNYQHYVFITPSGNFYKMTVDEPATEYQEGQSSVPIQIIEMMIKFQTVTSYEPKVNGQTWSFDVE